MLFEYIWNRTKFDRSIQEAFDLVEGKALIIQDDEYNRRYVLISEAAWYAFRYFEQMVNKTDGRKVKMRLQDGPRELLVYDGTPAEDVAAAIRAFRDSSPTPA